jgi:hypothetical protein
VPKSPKGTETRKTRSPFDRCQQAPEDQAEERPRWQGHPVDADGEAPLVGGERVGDDGTGVGEEEGAADPLAHPHDDDPQRRSGPDIQVTDSRMENTVKMAKPRCTSGPGRRCRPPGRS